MKNTLIVKKDFISDEVIAIVKNSNAGFVTIDIIDNGHSYIINFNPNKTEIDNYRKKLYNYIEESKVNISNIDTIVEGVIFSSIATLYSKVFTALMQETVQRYVKNNISKVSEKEINELIRNL